MDVFAERVKQNVGNSPWARQSKDPIGAIKKSEPGENSCSLVFIIRLEFSTIQNEEGIDVEPLRETVGVKTSDANSKRPCRPRGAASPSQGGEGLNCLLDLESDTLMTLVEEHVGTHGLERISVLMHPGASDSVTPTRECKGIPLQEIARSKSGYACDAAGATTSYVRVRRT